MVSNLFIEKRFILTRSFEDSTSWLIDLILFSAHHRVACIANLIIILAKKQKEDIAWGSTVS